MLETEFIKSLQNNYERVKLAEAPLENRYQYRIISRGGIGGLLPCSIRYINGESFLYYDITSRQPVPNMMHRKTIDRKWIQDFLWNLRRIRQECSRFLLDDHNVIWYPEQVFQNVNDTVFEFLYLPYWEGDNGFTGFLDFIIEHMDYQDRELVDFCYRMYEKFESFGEDYLREQLYEDAKSLRTAEERPAEIPSGKAMDRIADEEPQAEPKSGNFDWEDYEKKPEAAKKTKRGLLAFLESGRRKERLQREQYLREQELAMEGAAVAEENAYTYSYDEEEDEKTVYIENPAAARENRHRLLNSRGEVIRELESAESVLIGKKAGEVDVLLQDPSVSRIHARIFSEGALWYLEDQNSTNSTVKNALPLAPYEKRELHSGDEILLGNVQLTFR